MSSSNPEVPPSTFEEIIHMSDIPSKELPSTIPFPQELSQSDYEHAIAAAEKSLATKSSATMPETSTNRQDDLPKATQDDLVNSALPERVFQVTEEVSDKSSSIKGSVSKENQVILPPGSFNSEKFPIKTKSTVYCQELSQAADFLADIESSSTGIFEKKLCSKRQDILKSTEDGLGKVIGIFENILEETSSKKNSISTRNPAILPVECPDRKSVLEKNKPTSSINSSLSHETGSTSKLPFLADFSDTRKVPSLVFDDKLEQNTSGEILSNAIKSSSQLNFPNFERNSSPFTHEDIKSMEEGNVRRFVFLSTEKFSNGHETSSHSTPIARSFPTRDFPVSSATAISKDEPKHLDQEFEPTVSLDIISNNTLTEMLSTLGNWARKGLDNAFNGSLKISSKDIGANLKKDFQYGHDVIRAMCERIYSLIKAASKLPGPSANQHRGPPLEMNKIRTDVVRTGLTLWHTIDDIKFQVEQDEKKLVSIWDTDSVKVTKDDRERESSSNIVITNTCSLVTERLELLRAQLEDFRENIRAFCSEIEKWL